MAYETISYHAPGGKRIDEEHIRKLAVAHELTAGTVSLIDYDYTRSRALLGASKSDPGDTAFANAEHYGWGNYSQPLASSMGLSTTPNDYQGRPNTWRRYALMHCAAALCAHAARATCAEWRQVGRSSYRAIR